MGAESAAKQLGCVQKALLQSHRTESNCRPLDYESRALPLSYGGKAAELHGHALARIRTGTARATAPSRQRVYQFHHQGEEAETSCEDGTYSASSCRSSTPSTRHFYFERTSLRIASSSATVYGLVNTAVTPASFALSGVTARLNPVLRITGRSVRCFLTSRTS